MMDNALVDLAKEFVKKEVLPFGHKWDEQGSAMVDGRVVVPETFLNALTKLKELGFMSLTIPEAYNGLGLHSFDVYRIIAELAYGSPALAVTFAVNTSVMDAVNKNGTEEQKARYLPLMAGGEIIGGIALTEANAGSDPSGIVTKAQEEGDFYVLNGAKRFISSVGLAGLYIVFAVTGTTQDGRKEFSAFLVESCTVGFTNGKV